jgi:hypothetical protein
MEMLLLLLHRRLRVPRFERLADGVQLSTIADRIGYRQDLEGYWGRLGGESVSSSSRLGIGNGMVEPIPCWKRSYTRQEAGTLLNLW